MNRNSGLGQPGPRTYEQKGWRAEILKPLYLAFGLGCLLNLLWVAFTAFKWLDGDSAWWTKYVETSGAWLKVIVVEWMIAGVYLFLKWTETFWDDDYTTLTGEHPMLGILPMRPILRLFLFASWLRGLWQDRAKNQDNIDIEFRAKFGGEKDGE